MARGFQQPLTLQDKEQKMNLLLTSHQQEEQAKKDLENKVKDLEQAMMERSNTPEAPEPEETPVTEEEKPCGWWSRLFS
ncbi:hypothetical protein ACFS7Z_25830 [Pontibacter toksunensis]|uniref:Uncharacterized protein n=2 Tax=Pontibacter toksunensis TaxID=1332631 RepID=A0ABW6C4D9_9BACT